MFTKKISFFAVLLFAFSACKHEKTEPAEAPVAPVSEQVITLSAEQLKMADIQTGTPSMRALDLAIECSGIIDVPPQNMIAVHAPVKGIVKDVDQLPGSSVKKGQRLTALSHPELVRLQREFLENLSQLSMLEKEFTRRKNLASNEATSQKSLEQAEADYKLAKARYQGLKTELKLIGIDVPKLESTQVIQEQITLYSPIHGFIDKVNINPGKLVNAEDLLYQILDVSHVHAELRVFARDIPMLHEGQRIEVRVPGRSETYPAEVHLLSRMVDPESKTINVHGHFKPEPTPLFPGTFIQARIFTENKAQLTVPETAVIRAGDQAFVFVQKNNGFLKTPVRTGGTDGKFVVVNDLSSQSVIALSGAYYLNGILAGSEE